MPAGNVEELILRIIGDSVSGEEALKRVSKAWGQLGVQLQRKRAEIEQVGAGIERTSQDAGNAVTGLGNRLQDLSNQLDQAGRAGRFLGATFGAVAAGGGALIQATSRVAMRNEVLALSLYTVGENAGFGRQELDAMVEQVRELGITTSQARLGLTRMMQGQLSLAQATDIARASQNLAVIAGENSSETYGKIMESVLALQPRLLRQYGIVTTLDQALGDLANSNDVVAQRNQFLQFVLEEAARSAGVYENAMGVVGKRITSIPRLIEEAKNALGKHFLPIIGLGVDVLSRLLKVFESLPEGVQRMIAFLIMGGTAFAGLVAVVGGLLAVLPMVASGLSAVVGALGSVASAAGPVLIPILAALAAALAGLVAVGGVLAAAWKNDWGGIRTAVEEAWGKIQTIINELRPLISGWVTRIRTELRKIATLVSGFVTSFLEPVFGRISDLIRSINWADMLATFSDAINVAGRYITALLETIKRLLSGQGLQSFMPLEDAMIDVLTLIALTWDKYISRALTWGYNLIVQAANGIISAAQSVMVAAMRFVGNLIGNFLAPGSPPKEGPLSNILKWGKGLINTYLGAFKLADFSILRDALAPIRDVMESALAAGDLDEEGFVAMFGKVRDQVAALIAGFRETGEISEEALSGIADTLGAGSKELVRYLRLQLEHQKALDNLKEVQQEYAEAEEEGFVSAALKEKLKNAEDAAAAAEEEVNWQRELLSVQQESVDIQLRLVNALEKVASAMEDAGGGGGGGMLGMGDTGLGGLGDGIGAIRAELGVMSQDFLKMRARVQGLVSDFQDWLALPFDQKMKELAVWLTDITGIDFKKILRDIEDILDRIDEKGLAGALKGWLQSALDYVEKNLPRWSSDIAAYVLSAMVSAADALIEKAGESAQGLIDWFEAVINGLLTWMSESEVGWGDRMAFSIGAAMARLLTMLTVDIPMWVGRLVIWLGKIVAQFLTWLATEAPAIGLKLFKHFSAAIADWIGRLEVKIPDWKETLVGWAKRLIEQFAAGFLENAPQWMGDLQGVGAAIVDKIKQGISDTWGDLLEWFRRRLGDLANQLPFSEPKDPDSPLRGLADSGRALAQNLAAGIDFAPVRAALTLELARMQKMLSAGAGGFGTVSMSQQFGDIVFPNVRDERDAGFVRRGLERNALQAVMKSRTAGG